MSARTFKLIGAAGAAALAIGTMAGPADAAATSTASVNYTCAAPTGTATPSAVYTVAAAPAKMAAGQPLTTTASFTLDPATTALATGVLGWVKFKGSISTTPTASKAGLALSFPKTTLGNSTAGSTQASAKGSTLAGSKPGPFTFKLGNLGSVSLTGYDASGKKLGTVTFPNSDGSFGQCMNDAGSTTLMAGATAVTTTIVKDKTTTKAAASYSSKKDTATGKATVKSKFGIAATGKVTFTLKKGSKTVKTAKASLKKGVAKATFKGVSAKGKYSITGKYAGSSSLKGSSGKASFTVK